MFKKILIANRGKIMDPVIKFDRCMSSAMVRFARMSSGSYFASMVIATTLAFGFPDPAHACGQEAAWQAGELRKDLHRKWRSVRGTFTIDRIETELVKEDTFDGTGAETEASYETRTIWGTVTDRKGRTYRTIHENSDLVLLCSATLTPGYDAIGKFYLSRRPNAEGYYTLEDFDGEPLNLPTVSAQH